MLGYTEINPPMEIQATGDNILYGTAQGIALVLVRDTDDVCRQVKWPVVLGPELKSFFQLQLQHKRCQNYNQKGQVNTRS